MLVIKPWAARVCSRLLLCGGLFAAALSPVPAAAQVAPPPWINAPNFAATLERKDLRELLREIASTHGVTAIVDPDLKGSVNGRMDLSPQSLLDYLASSFGFVWFFDGQVLHVTPLDKMATEVLTLPNQSIDRTTRSLAALGLNDMRFPLSIDPATRVARVSGPQPYVDMVRDALQGMQARPEENDESVIRVIRLRHAFAGDQPVERGSTTPVPGVVAIMRKLFPPEGAAPSRTAPLSPAGASRVPRQIPVPGTDLRIPEVRRPSPDELPASTARNEPQRPTRNLPQFEADTRLNAVVVRDLPDRIGLYEEFIRSLDIRPVVVEIEARVIEVSTDEFESLGLDWRLTGRRGDIQVGRGPLPGLNAGNALNGGGPPFAGSGGDVGTLGNALSSGIIASTLLTDSGITLIARINALQQRGKGSVLSAPRVLTLDNIEAVIQDTRTFYVRVAAERDAGLFQISAGTTLRVKPMVIEEDGKRQIKMAIQIDDGTPTSATVDGIPVVRNTSIGTWAYVNESQSLLIGGFTQEQHADSISGVPVLSAVPVFGNLFKTREKDQMMVQRLFMLTPRVVELQGGG